MFVFFEVFCRFVVLIIPGFLNCFYHKLVALPPVLRPRRHSAWLRLVNGCVSAPQFGMGDAVGDLYGRELVFERRETSAGHLPALLSLVGRSM